METEEHFSDKCAECGKTIQGRTDKKFCSDECRIAFHNKFYREKNKEVIRINKILKRNYSILKYISRNFEGKCTIKKLFEAGFSFDFMTSVGNCGRNKIKMYCYDLEYSINKEGVVTITSIIN